MNYGDLDDIKLNNFFLGSLCLHSFYSISFYSDKTSITMSLVQLS